MQELACPEKGARTKELASSSGVETMAMFLLGLWIAPSKFIPL